MNLLVMVVTFNRYRIFMVIFLCLGTWVLPGCVRLPIVPDAAESMKPVLFTYEDDSARKVCLAGDFNRWSPESHCLIKKGSQWSIQVKLSQGHYQYLFLVDDRLWEQDPGNTLKEDSGFGVKNSVLIVQ